jgi:hypothetical protein
MTEDEFIRFLNETLELISSHAAGGAIVYACMDWRPMGEMPDIFVNDDQVDSVSQFLRWLQDAYLNQISFHVPFVVSWPREFPS